LDHGCSEFRSIVRGPLTKPDSEGEAANTEHLTLINGYGVFHDEASGRFEILVEGLTAELTYRIEGDRIFLLNTWVPAAVEGRGIGSTLVHAAVAEAKRRSLTVVPVCSFVRFWLEKHPDEQVAVEWPP